MVTAIFVYEPSTVTIRATDPRDVATIRRYPKYQRDDRPALGTLTLEAGIYAILSGGPLELEWHSGRAEHVATSKDDWPDPAVLPEGATRAEVREYFAMIAKSADVD